MKVAKLLRTLPSLTVLLSTVAAAQSFDMTVMADADGDGLVSLAEFKAFSAMKWRFLSQGRDSVTTSDAPPSLRPLLKGVNPGPNGRIDRDDVIAYAPVRYREIDTNKDGTVSVVELQTASDPKVR